MKLKVDECEYPERENCRDCFHSKNPDLSDGGCELCGGDCTPEEEYRKCNRDKPATDKQMSYAESIAEELGIDLPEEHTMSEISMFIDDNKDDFYQSRRERLGGYGEMQDRIDRREIS